MLRSNLILTKLFGQIRSRYHCSLSESLLLSLSPRIKGESPSYSDAENCTMKLDHRKNQPTLDSDCLWFSACTFPHRNFISFPSISNFNFATYFLFLIFLRLKPCFGLDVIFFQFSHFIRCFFFSIEVLFIKINPIFYYLIKLIIYYC